MGTKTERRGTQYGNTRGKERQKRKRDNRAKDPRWVTAMEDTRKAQADLDELIAKQQKEPAVGEVPGAMYAAQLKQREEDLAKAKAREAELAAEEAAVDEAAEEVVTSAPVPAYQTDGDTGLTGLPISYDVPKFDKRSLPKSGDGNFQFAATTARLMLKQGYHVKYVLEFTGLGWEDVRELPIDEDGWGIRPEEPEDAVE